VWGSGFTPLCFVADDVAVEPAKGLGNSFRFERNQDGRPLRLVGLNSGRAWEYNDGPSDPLGPDRAVWAPLLGSYQLSMYGAPGPVLQLRRLRGWLYLGKDRIVAEGAPGVLFTSTGETLDLRPDAMRYLGGPITRTSEPRADAAAAAEARARELAALLAAGELDALLEAGTQELREAGVGEIASAWRQLEASWGPHRTFGRADVVSLGDSTRVDLATLFAGVGWTVGLTFDAQLQLAGVGFWPPASWWLSDPQALASLP
jgi:hypothetical protein